VSAPEAAPGRPAPEGSPELEELPVIAPHPQGRTQLAYEAWLAHVEVCQADCRVRGRDCATAMALRTELRRARGEGGRP
jgi:hypothetical protein